MPVLARMAALPLSVDVRGGAVSGLGALLCDQRISANGHVAVAVGRGQGEEIARVLELELPEADVFLVRDGTVDAGQELAASLRRGSYDAVAGIGGGRTLDVAKYAASHTGLPMVSVATSLAHDGLASPVASLEHGNHKGSFGVHTPISVVVDLDYVRRSPLDQLRSGIGDAISNLSALADWELASRQRGEPWDGVAAALARSAAESLLWQSDPLDDERLLTTLANGLIQSGLAMAIAGSSRPCSGACHEIAHAVDALYPHTSSHGAQVAVGMMFASFLRDDPALTAIDACLTRYGVPRLPADLGLSDEQFVAAVVRAPSTRPDRYTILEHLALDENEIRERVEAFLSTFAAAPNGTSSAPLPLAPSGPGLSSKR
ncbi:MAG: iron-containing alcohol dehydrogenase family protein [Actinomycetota bacterium]|nr:iron-containing alcohol dehydrogenase family protein [Actinomycetota bacterium]